MQQAATAVVRRLLRQLKARIPIVGVGGIDSANAAQEKFDAGATLIQLYSGLIYRGPSLLREIMAV